MNRLRTFLPVALILLSGCAPITKPTSAPQLILPSPSAPVRADVATPAPENTVALATETPTPFPMTEAPPPLPTATTGAMQLFFPTVIPVQGAEYRPPLYPIPWAISPYDHFYFAAPIAAAYPGEPIWDFRYGGNFFGPDAFHTGIDLPAPRGTDVLAAGPGTIVWAGVGLYSGSPANLKDPYGQAVAIRHDFGYQGQQLFTVYAHMEEIDVVVGQWLNTGDVIGKVGDTGLTTGPHLHFEVRLGENSFWKTRNPELWLAPPQGEGVLVGRVMDEHGALLNLQLVSMKNAETGKMYNAFTYGPTTVNSDAYYNENVVMSDLPAGVYELDIRYGAFYRGINITILPGQVAYFSFSGISGYDTTLPTATMTATPTATLTPTLTP